MVGEIHITDVYKQFPNTDPTKEDIVALNGFSLDIKPGSFVSLIGPSGCGKSTLLRIIGGLDKATKGTIELDGKEIKKPGSDRGFAFQGSNLFPWLTVEKNIAFGLKARHIYKEQKKDVADFKADQLVVPGRHQLAVHGVHPLDSEFHCPAAVQHAGCRVNIQDLFCRGCHLRKGGELGLREKNVKVGHRFHSSQLHPSDNTRKLY